MDRLTEYGTGVGGNGPIALRASANSQHQPLDVSVILGRLIPVQLSNDNNFMSDPR